MDEQEWNECGDPEKMLHFLQVSGRLSERKGRLFACAAVRQVWHLLTDERSRRAVEIAECYADGLIGEEKRLAVTRAAINATWEYKDCSDGERAAEAACSVIDPGTGVDAGFVASLTALSGGHLRAQAALLRDIFGHFPFRPLAPLDSSARTWNDGLIPKLATAIYEQRKLPEGTLCSVRMSVLADAMEESGVTDQDVLGHLRRQGAVHVRGCFALDYILGKE